MSNIPASKRSVTKIDFFDKAIKLRSKIVAYISFDFNIDNKFLEDGEINEDYWVVLKVRNAIYKYAQDMIGNITQANSIYITSLYEYNVRRKYMTEAIGNCEQIIQELQFAIRYLHIKPAKYVRLTKEIKKEEDSLRKWRKSDNKTLTKIKSQS